jgi:flagellar hook-associated protein 3 FlgL
MTNSRLSWISDGRARTAEAERSLSTGRRIDQPSDDPAVSTQLMRHTTRLRRIDQFSRNSATARLWIDGADAALQAAANQLGRAKTLAVQAGNDTMGPVERAAIAADIRAIADGLRTIANTKVSGRAIFAGTADATNAYDGAESYLGDARTVELDIDTAETVVIGLPGPEVFGGTNPTDPMNGTAFEALRALADAVEAADTVLIRDGIEAVDSATARVGAGQGRVGATSRQLDAAEFRHGGERLEVGNTVSKLGDTDMAEAIIRLRSAEAGYQATLSATARALSTSLLDFLR